MIEWTWMERADRTLETARRLLDADPSSACNRAYYAMFYAARAALLRVDQAERAAGKSHSGMISAFSGHLVRPGLIAPEHGRAFARVEQHRLAGDYLGPGVPLKVAAESVDQAAAFVTAVRGWMTAQTDQPAPPSAY